MKRSKLAAQAIPAFEFGSSQKEPDDPAKEYHIVHCIISFRGKVELQPGCVQCKNWDTSVHA